MRIPSAHGLPWFSRASIAAIAATSLLATTRSQDPVKPEAGGSASGEALRRLEERNRLLEARVGVLESAQSEGTGAAQGSEEDEGGIGLGMTARRGDTEATLQLFGDVGFGTSHPKPAAYDDSAFGAGGMNAFFTARVGDHFQVLSETVVKRRSTATADGFVFDLERLYGAWTFDDRLYLKFGLEHSPVSRWNRIYHHGRWLETSIERPMMARFESGSGILPLHQVGLEVGGRQQTGIGGIEYRAIVSNGRGFTPDAVQKIADRSEGKAIDVGLDVLPECIQGLRVGTNIHYEEIGSIPTDPTRVRPIRESILGVSAEYRSGDLEVISEFTWLQHDDRTSHTTFRHDSGYAQFAWRVDRWTPYTRIDFRNMESGDPFYMPMGRDLDRWEHVLGVRHELTDNAAVKIEGGWGEVERRVAGGTSTTDFFEFGVQLAWVF